MNIELRDFQQAAVEKFVSVLRKAARDAKDGELQAVSLSSPTGSGKTVMLIEAMERILQGDEQRDPQPDATFLWITDQPELNAQTRDKMLAFSTVLSLFTLTIIDTEFDEPQLAPGHVYFLNTQKLGRNSSLVAPGDRRQFSLWDTLNITAQERPGQCYVIIDEAHRGMGQSKQAVNEANSIIQKFILGSPDEIKPVPLLVGISATPKRFQDLLQIAQSGPSPRTIRQVTVDPADVRESGLIKDVIQFTHPTESQPSDMTLLRAAVASWQEYETRWAAYCAEQSEPPVRPLLAVQVADGSKAGAISETDLAEALTCIEDVAGTLPPSAFAHAFQDHGALDIAGRSIRYLAPSEIAADTDARVVFFKTSLTTGWDCPRAEVMMSFRSAADATLIAQLVGRMVRTPLVRRIDADEHLNTVALFLPHYDKAGLEQVVKKLTDGELALPEIRTEPTVSLSRSEGSEPWFALLASLPSYHVPRAPTPNETKRLLRLAFRISNDGVYPDAWDKARDLLLGLMDTAFERCCDTPAFRQIVDERDTLDIRLVSYLYGEDTAHASAAQQIAVSPENVEDLFETAGRKLGEGLHRDWRTRRVETTDVDPRRAKLELIALATADLKRDLDKAAAAQTQTWLTLYGLRIRDLPEKKRQEYDKMQDLAADPVLMPLVFPVSLDAKAKGEQWVKHLYAADHGHYPADLNAWEKQVIKEEFKRPDLRAWLRVVPRQKWALCIPYASGDKTKSVYVDFLICRETPTGRVVDIIDPHTPSFSDAADKLAGLALYAEEHGAHYGRIESIILDGDDIRRLNLQDSAIRDHAKYVKTPADVQRLFAAYAVSAPTA